MFGNPLLLGDDGYQIQRSVRLRSSASAYLQRTNSTTGTDQLKFTVSGWIKRGLSSAAYFPLIGSDTGSNAFDFIGFQSDNLAFRIRNSSSVDLVRVESNAVYRDFSAWYHVVAVYDSANATASERVKLYVNGVQLTAFGTATYPSLNLAPSGDFLTDMQIGRTNTNNVNQNYGDGYLAEVNFIDGQALTPSSFGETDAVTGVWKPKKYAGTYGTNGFYLNFSDNSGVTATTIGKDYSGNGNNWTPNNISVTAGTTYDSMLDVPTPWADGGNGRGNYPVWNPLQKGASAINTTATLSQANLLATGGAINNTWSATSTFVLPQTGKWYFECEMSPTSYGNGQFGLRSLSNSSVNCYAQLGVGAVKNNATAYSYTGYNTGSTNKIGIAYDADNNLYWQTDINGTWLNSKTPGVDTTGLVNGLTAANDYVIGWAYNSGAEANLYCYVNFGQRPFSYTPPSGFKALHTGNLPDPTIRRGNQYFDATTYTGNGTNAPNALTVTNSGSMQPDMVWIKRRDISVTHVLQDSVRGLSTFLSTESISADQATSGRDVSSLNSNGFTVSYNNARDNAAGGSYVAWQWKEGATQGFDIVTYTGTGVSRTVSHSLGVAPKLVIIKDISATNNWSVNGNVAGLVYGTNYLQLNTTVALAANTTQVTSVSSSTISLGTGLNVNSNGDSYIAYIFAPVDGFSAIGSYTGNGANDGPFVYLGFRPKFLLLKVTNTTGSWTIMDSARNTYNAANYGLFPDLSDAEATDRNIDFVSNGFKLRTLNYANTSGWTYMYMAFAENPFKYSLAR